MLRKFSFIFAVVGVLAIASGCAEGNYEEPLDIQEPEEDTNTGD